MYRAHLAVAVEEWGSLAFGAEDDLNLTHCPGGGEALLSCLV